MVFSQSVARYVTKKTCYNTVIYLRILLLSSYVKQNDFGRKTITIWRRKKVDGESKKPKTKKNEQQFDDYNLVQKCPAAIKRCLI